MPHEVRGVDVEKDALLCQQTSPKRWFGNMEMMSNCDVTNSEHQIQMTTIRPWTKPPPWKFSAYATDQVYEEGIHESESVVNILNNNSILVNVDVIGVLMLMEELKTQFAVSFQMFHPGIRSLKIRETLCIFQVF